MVERLCYPVGIRFALRGDRAAAVHRFPDVPHQIIVQQRIAGSGVAGDQRLAVDIGNVGDAADIDDAGGHRAIGEPRQSTMIDRHQRRALPASGDIGGAEIVHHRQSQRLRKPFAFADLDRQPVVRPMQNGLAVKADDIDRGAIDLVCREKRFHRLGMCARDEIFRGCNLGREFLAPRDLRCGVERLAQQYPLLLAIGPVSRRPEGFDLLAVGPQPRDIHPVERGAAHQAYRVTHGVPPVELDAGPDTPRSL